MDLKKIRLKKNIAGPFFVDSSCIDCGSCWRIDPKHFAPDRNTAYVHAQPNGTKEIQKAFLALLDCPVSAIGASKEVTADCSTDTFPIFVTKYSSGEVYYCGWSSRKSFGASSWLIRSNNGNVLIDSPRWSPILAKRLLKMGGISQMILTHRDDVADHAQWSQSLRCERWIHEDDLDAAPDVENTLIGMRTLSLRQYLKLIPTPGHTQGSIVILLDDQQQILFSGDHLWWDLEKQALVASKDYCWWSWAEQLKSIKKLQDLDVRWLLPGHGHAKHFKEGEWKAAVEQTLQYEKDMGKPLSNISL
ncbi:MULTISPECIES: MBL fold metallo-hydrolase [unclassified Prochlorococcus]|uniref:MBL fold metallo-hydrolase n=1 Tax=unclassified Prochlorococcus TaxID=2627481 RepID=UPI000533BA0C|nr:MULTISPECIES: MBL fold metallo-hydrolase [unclassified Prochlorococcus]KGG14916.1 Metallo-beta-lactamase hydrolase [Prochlorococcus sp. MIT 0602]KGG15651.1 Metallo-beta-lactamase hydrolase [Prochlorococcus sp. MIT 0603]